MDRRHFIKFAGATTLSPSLIHGMISLDKTMMSKNIIAKDNGIYNRLVEANDTLIQDLLKKQELDPSHRWFGGVPNIYGIHTVQ
jgi:hypothetical protein